MFLENFTNTEQINKNGFQLANFWVFKKIYLSFWKKLLEFFSNVQKKPDVILQLLCIFLNLLFVFF